MTDKIEGVIARWTTPTIHYIPKAVEIENIVEAEITIRQLGRVILHKTMREATIVEGGLLWDFTQQETARMTVGTNASIKIDFKTSAGTRYTTRSFEYEVIDSAVNEVI